MTRERTNRPFLGTLPGLILGCLVSCGLWGSAYPCVKIGYELFGITGSDVASRLVFAGTRFTIAGIMVVVGVSIAQRRALLPAKRDLGAIGILALFQTVLQYFFFYGGLSHAAGVTSSIIGAAAYFFAILFAALIFKTENLTRKAVIGCTIGFAGVVLVNLGGSGDAAFSFALNGEGFILLSSIAGAISTCFIAVLGSTHDSVLLSGWQFGTGGVVLLGCGLAMGGSLCPISPRARARPHPLYGLYLGHGIHPLVKASRRKSREPREYLWVHDARLWRSDVCGAPGRDRRREPLVCPHRARARKRGHRYRQQTE